MSTLTLLRDKYGLKQEDIAQWSGVSRSLVGHYEKFKREMPPIASEKYGRLHTMMANIEIAGSKIDGQPHPKSIDALKLAMKGLEFRKLRAHHKVGMMRKKLLNLQKKYTQTRDLLEFLEMMMIEVTEEKNKNDFLWLQNQYNNAVERLQGCDEAAQLIMQMNIAALEGVANFEF